MVQLVGVSEKIDDGPTASSCRSSSSAWRSSKWITWQPRSSIGARRRTKLRGAPTLAPIGYPKVKKVIDGRIIRPIEIEPKRAPAVWWTKGDATQAYLRVASLRYRDF